jgi:anti-sigma regulatory factor (Ser/Thr protein kinase)
MITKRQLIVPAQHDQLAQLATFVAVAAAEVGFDETQVNRIELAVDEACSNIIDHAYKGDTGSIQLEVDIEPQHQLTIVLIDQGQSFNPDHVPAYAPCTSLDEVKIGGLGIHLMRQAMDDVCYEFGVPGIGNRLTMKKQL